MAFEYLSLVLAGVAILLVAGWSTSRGWKQNEDVPSDLPWVGLQHGIFSKLRTRIASLGTLLETIESGYREYSKEGLSFVLPGVDKAMVLVPADSAKWLADQPSSVLSAKAMQREMLQTDYCLLDRQIGRNPIHATVIRRDLTRQMGNLISDIEEELNVGVDSCWGTNTDEWKDIWVFDTMMKVVTRTSNRVFVGLPLCRNDQYLGLMASYAEAVAISSVVLRIIPSFLRSFLAWVCVLPSRWIHYRASKLLLPYVKQRIVELEKVRGTKDEPNDYLSWYINEIIENPNPAEKSPEMIVLRLMTINFAAIHTSTFTATNILFDLYSSPHAEDYVREIREEVTAAIESNGGVWDKHVVGNLVKVDSAIRESLRISTFIASGMARLVVAPKGVTMPNGQYLPCGTRVGISTYSIHHDDDIFEDAMTYDAFRFSTKREKSPMAENSGPSSSTHSRSASSSSSSSYLSTGSGRSKEELAKLLEGKNLSTVTTSETFLSFGHGRHACPGRFFAVIEMKLLLAYIVMNYDIKPLSKRPPNGFVGGNILPPMKATISVRRRKM